MMMRAYLGGLQSMHKFQVAVTSICPSQALCGVQLDTNACIRNW